MDTIVSRSARPFKMGGPDAYAGSVSGILVRTLEQTLAEYRAGVKADRWEPVLVELVLPAG